MKDLSRLFHAFFLNEEYMSMNTKQANRFNFQLIASKATIKFVTLELDEESHRHFIWEQNAENNN